MARREIHVQRSAMWLCDRLRQPLWLIATHDEQGGRCLLEDRILGAFGEMYHRLASVG